MVKMVRAVLLSLVLGIALLTPVNAKESLGESWIPPAPTSTNYKSVTITDSIQASETFSRLWAQGASTFFRYVCKSVDDSNCSTAPIFDFQSILPVCTIETQSDCVESLSSGRVGSQLVDGSFLSYSVSEHPNNFRTDKELGLIENSNPSTWSLPASPHEAGTQYTVAVGIRGYLATRLDTSGKRIAESIDTVLYGFLVPTKLVTDARSEFAQCVQAPSSTLQSGVIANTRCTGSQLAVDPALKIKCTFSSGNDGDCLSPLRFPADMQFRLSIRLAKEPIAWLHGRMTDPAISITSDPRSSGIRLSVTASPARVPVMHHGVDWANAPEATKDWWRTTAKNCDSAQNCRAGGTNPEMPFNDIEKNEISMSVPPYGSFPIEVIRGLKSATDDTSAAEHSIWSFRTLPANELRGANRCIADGPGVKGVVTTNATAYVEGPPVFEDDSLNYRVAALHKLPNGEVFRGTYSLIVRSDVARCLYGFTDAPIRAEVSVIGDGGTSSVVTTSSSEVGGWFNLNAANFTFSAPSIKVKLSQEQVVVTNPTEPPSKTTTATAEPTKKKRFVCVKGAKKLRVVGINPKCAKGYKLRKG